MPDVRDGLREGLRAALAAAGVDPVPETVAIERPRERSHGDWSSNVALAVAKAAGRRPRELAEQIVAHLSAEPPPHVEVVEAAGPGFVNFRLAPSWLHEVLRTVVAEGVEGYARSDAGRGADGERGVRVGQPDRPAARRPRPVGRLRRLAMPAAGALRP